MLLPRLAVWIFSAGAVVLGAGTLCAQVYPNKPVRIVTAQAGGGSDFVSRLIAPGLSGGLSQQVIIENRGGGSGIIAIETVTQAPADGYTLLSYGNIWILPLMRDNVPYDVLRDLSPVTLQASAPNVLMVHPSLPVRSVKELIVLAKARPGEINYGSGGTGSGNHIAAELFKAMAGVNIARIPYRGAGQALTALIGGEVHMAFASAGSAAPHMKSGKLRALAVTRARPSPLLPGLPTVAATVPGYESIQMFGIFAPARTPAAIIQRLNQEIVRVLNTSEVKERLFNAGVEVVGSSPEEFAAAIRSEIARLGKMIRDAGIRAE